MTSAPTPRVKTAVTTELFVTPHLGHARILLGDLLTALRREPGLAAPIAAFVPRLENLYVRLGDESNGSVEIEHEVTFELDAKPVRVESR